MVTKAITAAAVGINAYKIEVEVDVINSLPNISIVGLPDNAVNEAKERVHSAIKNSGFTFPLGRVIVNLAPADIRKEGTNFDLPIAIGILKEQGINMIFLLAHTGEMSKEGGNYYEQFFDHRDPARGISHPAVLPRQLDQPERRMGSEHQQERDVHRFPRR